MELVEVVLQGVRGSPSLSRWVIPAGVAIVPAGDREALLARVVYELLAGIQDGSVAQALLPGEAGAQGRVAIIVVGRDQRRYRVLWDLKTGRRALQVQNAGGHFDILTTTQAEILQALTATVGFPQQDVLREIFFAFVDDLPSRRSSDTVAKTAASSSSGKALPPGFGDDTPAKRDSDKPLPPGFGDDDDAPTSPWLGKPTAALKARLEEIEALSEGQQDVSQLEFELDGLQKKIFEIDSRLKPLLELSRNVELLEQQLGRLGHLQRLPADFLQRAWSLHKAKADHDASLLRLADDRDRLLTSADHLSDEISGLRQRGGPRPLQAALNDPLVKFGTAGGVAAIFVAAFGSMAFDGLRWLGLLNIPAFGAAVFGGVRLLSSLEEGASIRVKLLRLDSDMKRDEERFNIDKEQIERLLQKNELTFAQLPELEQQWKLRDDLLSRLQPALEQREIAQQQGDVVALQAEQAGAQARIRTLEEQLQTAGQRFDGGAADLLKEKDEIVKILRGELKAETAPTPKTPKVDLDDLLGPGSGPVTVTAGPTTAFDAGQRIVRLASDVLLGTLEDTALRLSPRATQMTQALTDNRFSALRFGSKAEVSVVDAASGQAIAFIHLPAGDRDLVALALRLATAEAFAKKERMPLIFDRIFDTFSVDKAPLLVRVLQFLGQGTQVICLTGRRELATAGPVVTAA